MLTISFSDITDDISANSIYERLFIDKGLRLDFTKLIGLDPDRYFFGIEIEGTTIYDNEISICIYKRFNDIPINMAKGHILPYAKYMDLYNKNEEERYQSFCETVSNIKVREKLTKRSEDIIKKIGRVIVTSDLYDIFKYYHSYGEIDTSAAYLYKDYDNKFVAMINFWKDEDEGSARRFRSKEHDVDYIHGLLEACISEDHQWKIEHFFETCKI